MYKSYFGFDEAPFSITPDPKFIYMSQRHEDALAHLRYGLFETNGFVLLTGEVGTGKTALCRCLLEQLPKTIDIAFILNPKQTALELVANICDELHLQYPDETTSIKVLIDLLNKKLLDNHTQGRRTVLIIDEAQNLSDEVLEQTRLLTNLETSKRKLLQILLVGQPELQDMLARPVMRQLTQRITARYHIAPLSQVETTAYIRHRMWIAGVQRPIFSGPAIDKIYHLCNGTPRLINIICDRALLGAYAKNSDTIDVKMVTQAACEILPNAKSSFFNPTRKIIAASIILTSFAVAAYTLPPWGRLDTPSAEEPHVISKSASTQSAIQPIAKETTAPEPATLQPGDAQPAKLEREAILSLHQNRRTPLVVDTALATVTTDKHRTYDTADNTANAAISLSDLLNDSNCNSGSETAVSDLFGLWGITYRPEAGRTACDMANSAGLSCVQSQGTWNNLRRYNRPAIIELQSNSGHWQHLLISALNEEGMLLSCGKKTARITFNEADKHWFGEYLIFWQPPKRRMRFERGNRGEDVRQFRTQIKAALGIHGTKSSDIFDATLEELVIKFQQNNSLKADGVAGKETIILLNTLTKKAGVPLLAAVER